MNKQRRKSIDEIASKMADLLSELESIIEEEQECYDNLPEGLQYSERGETMREGIDDLQNIYDDLENEIECLSEYSSNY